MHIAIVILLVLILLMMISFSAPSSCTASTVALINAADKASAESVAFALHYMPVAARVDF